MTIAQRYPARNKWRCDSCGKEEMWNDNWYQYSSIIDQETLPIDDIVTVCSDKCMNTMKRLIREGKVATPHAKAKGYTVKIVGKRKGY